MMTDELRIRRAGAEDAPEWWRMRCALWPHHGAQELREEMDGMLADERQAVFVAERAGGGLGGFIEAGTRDYADGCDTSPVGYLEAWYVDEDLRRQGAGGALVRAAEEWARSRGLSEMASDTWLWNETSIAAHAALGYEEYERLVHFRKKLEER